jgi:hypothetical protein
MKLFILSTTKMQPMGFNETNYIYKRIFKLYGYKLIGSENNHLIILER